MLFASSRGYGVLMTSTLDRPDCPPVVHGPAEVRAALVEVGSGIENWDKALDRVYAQALREGSLDRVREFLDRSWHGVVKAREIMAHGARPADQRMSRERFRELAEDRNGRPLPNAA